MKDYDHFPAHELICKCGNCDGGEMDDAFMADLISVREEIDVPFIVNSAYRCPEYNASVSSTGLDGPHTTGKAIDIRAGSRLKFQIMDAFMKRGYSRIGIAKTFIHIDGDGTKPPQVIWQY